MITLIQQWPLLTGFILIGVGIVLAVVFDNNSLDEGLIKSIKPFIAQFGFVIFIGGLLLIAGAAGYRFFRWLSDRSPAPQIVFSGKVINEETGEWLNDRLVLVFLRGKEIGRDVTKLGEFSESGQGVHDGLFVINVNNTYSIKRDDVQLENSSFNRARKGYYYHYFDNIIQGGLISASVPSKNITYIIKVLEGNVATMPSTIMTPGSTRLKGDGTVIVALGEVNAPQSPGKSNPLIQEVEYGVATDTVELNKITVPLNNCGGSDKLIQHYTQTQTFIHEYQVEAVGSVNVDVPLPIGWLDLVLELQAKYGYEQGQIDTQTVDTTLGAEAGTNQVYIITWQEVWESGKGTVLAGDEMITIPFRSRTNLIHKIDSERLSCK